MRGGCIYNVIGDEIGDGRTYDVICDETMGAIAFMIVISDKTMGAVVFTM
jgi:hypothetical protein